MTRRSIKSIQDELVNIVTGFYRDDLDILDNMTPYEQYEAYYETIGFLFVDYEQDFDRSTEMKFNDFRKSFLDMQKKMFITWCTHHVHQRIRKIQDEKQHMLMNE